MVWFLKAALLLAAVISSESCGSRRSPPKKCKVSQWTKWSECSETCGVGTLTRTRAVTNGVYPCSTSLIESTDCFLKKCPIHCIWGNWSSWSSCPVCGVGSKWRQRQVKSPAYYGGKICNGPDIHIGSPCDGEKCPPNTINCNSTQFTCNNKIECVDKSLTCNHDYDCNDDSDEANCENNVEPVCKIDYLQLNAEDFAMGYDVRTGKSTAKVLDHNKYNGNCLTIYDGNTRGRIRLPHNLLLYHDQTSADTVFIVQSYSSVLSIMEMEEKTIRKSLNSGFSLGIPSFFSLGFKKSITLNQQSKSFYEFNSESKYKYFTVERNIQIGGFKIKQNNLNLSPDFLQQISLLPTNYDYNSYRIFINNFGTHFYSEGTLGGKLTLVLKYREIDLKKSKLSDEEQIKCLQSEFGISVTAFDADVSAKNSNTKCSTDALSKEYHNRFSSAAKDSRATAIGGSPSTISSITVNDKNILPLEKYENWAKSLHEYPAITEFKTEPITTLIKDSTIRSNLDRAIKEALEKYDSSICIGLTCHNGGKVAITDEGKSCICLCENGYYGDECSEELPP